MRKLEYSIADQVADKMHIRMLAGATTGRRHMKCLRDELSRVLAYGDPVWVCVNFQEVEAATGSYLKATICWLLLSGQLAAATTPQSYSGDGTEAVPLDIYPTVRGVAPEVGEELDLVLGERGLACIDVTDSQSGNSDSGLLRGRLDRALRDTLVLLCRFGQGTATSLCEAFPEEKINVTGWNNRLAELHKLRLAIRSKEGRQWVYTPIVKEVKIG